MEAVSAPKHQLTRWNAKVSSFAAHKDDVQKQMSSYNITFITDAGHALFLKYNEKREEHCTAGTVLNPKIDEWTDEDTIKHLTKYFGERTSGNVINRLSICRTRPRSSCRCPESSLVEHVEES